MDNFWKNIFRYPKFFVSSLIGLILIILTPFKNLFKIKKLRIYIIIIFLISILSLYIIIRKMGGL